MSRSTGCKEWHSFWDCLDKLGKNTCARWEAALKSLMNTDIPTENKAHFFCRTLFVCCNQSHWIAVHLCQRNQPWINYSEICEKFVGTLSLKSNIIFVISAALYEGNKNIPAIFRGQRGDAILFCSPTLVTNVCCVYEWDNCHHADVEYDVVGSQISASALCCSGVFGSRSLPPTTITTNTHTYIHMPVASRGLWSAQ